MPKARKLALMPISGMPKAKKNSTIVSGQFRKTVTHATPRARSGGTGETRKAAMSVPSNKDPTIAYRQIFSETKKPSR